MFFARPHVADDYLIPTEAFPPFSLETLSGLGDLPDATREYYRWAKANGRRPFPFHASRHIFFRGEVDTSGLEVITV